MTHVPRVPCPKCGQGIPGAWNLEHRHLPRCITTLDDLLRIGNVERGDDDACWLWGGSLDDDGYGRRVRYQGRTRKPHVVALMIKLGRELAPGTQANHTCDVPACVNVSHLYEGTQRQNVLDAVERGRWRPRPTHCPKNHAYTPENTRVTATGTQVCRTCNAESARRYRERARQTDQRVIG